MKSMKEVMRSHVALTKSLNELNMAIDKTKARVHYTKLYEEICNATVIESISFENDLKTLEDMRNVLVLQEKMLARQLAKNDGVDEVGDERIGEYIERLRSLSKHPLSE